MIKSPHYRRLITLFWATWWLIACWTDIIGGLAHLQILHASWAPDTNYPFLLKSLSLYPTPSWLPPLLFIGIICWTGIISMLFTLACYTMKSTHYNLAFSIALSFWLVMFVADQLIMNFSLEQNHMVQGSFLLLTWLATDLLPLNTSYKQK